MAEENDRLEARRRLHELTDPEDWTEEEKKEFEHVRNFQIQKGRTEKEAEQIAVQTVRDQRDREEKEQTHPIRETSEEAARLDKRFREDKAEREENRAREDENVRTQGERSAREKTDLQNRSMEQLRRRADELNIDGGSMDRDELVTKIRELEKI